MGVRGLTTFATKYHSQLCIDLKFVVNDSETEAETKLNRNLIVDGYSFLYHIANDINWILGASQQIYFSNLIRNYLFNLKKFFNFIVFVFDGPEAECKKETKIQRELQKIETLKTLRNNLNKGISLVKSNGSNDNVASFMTLTSVDIFMELASVEYPDIKLITPDFEADAFISQIASSFGGDIEETFVLSQDSDFFIHHTERYLPFEYFIMEKFPTSTVLKSKCFNSNNLLALLNLNKTSIPLLATLAGCDYFFSDIFFKRLCLEMKMSKRDCKFLTISKFLNKFDSLFKVNVEDPTNTIEVVLNLMFPEETDFEIKKLLVDSCLEYKNTQKITLFELEKYYMKYDDESDSGYFHSYKLLEVRKNKVFWCNVLISDVGKRSVWYISRFIRVWIYAILCANTLDSKEYKEWQGDVYEVTEYMRKGFNFQPEMVKPVSFGEFYAELCEKEQNVDIKNFSKEKKSLLHLKIMYSKTDIILEKQNKLDPVMLSLIVALRSLIIEVNLKESRNICNFEVVSFLVTFLKVKNINEVENASNPEKDVFVTSNPLHRLAQFETILFNQDLLLKSLHLRFAKNYHFSSKIFFEYYNLSKGGSSLKRLLVGLNIKEFDELHDLFSDLTDKIDEIFNYKYSDLETAPKVKNKDDFVFKEKKRKIAPKKKVLKSNNIFDVLTLGCEF
ncbi:Protein asteroid 1 [Lobulomyces angularis]|nr:Protein asteroid 1 [Lobulomyces angularis]